MWRARTEFDDVRNGWLPCAYHRTAEDTVHRFEAPEGSRLRAWLKARALAKELNKKRVGMTPNAQAHRQAVSGSERTVRVERHVGGQKP